MQMFFSATQNAPATNQPTKSSQQVNTSQGPSLFIGVYSQGLLYSYIFCILKISQMKR